jgi:hypothetical protein
MRLRDTTIPTPLPLTDVCIAPSQTFQVCRSLLLRLLDTTPHPCIITAVFACVMTHINVLHDNTLHEVDGYEQFPQIS